MGCAGVKCAVDQGGARGHVAHQQNTAILIGDGLGLNRAAVFYQTAHQCAGTAGGHQHQTAVGHQHVLVLNQCIDDALVQFQRGQAVATEYQRGFVASRQSHSTLVRHDDAFIAYLGCEKSNEATERGLQCALVDHAGVRAVATETAFARHEIFIADAQGGDQQTADIYLRLDAKDHATGIADEHLPRRVDAPHDLAGVATHHPIERDRRCRRLVEIHPRIAADIEAVPVDRRAVTALVDVERAARGADAGTTADHFASAWQLAGGRCSLRSGQTHTQACCGQSDSVRDEEGVVCAHGLEQLTGAQPKTV